MKKLSSIIGVAALALATATLGTGCAAQMHTLNANTPHTTFKGNLGGQSFEFENPKDTVMEGFTASLNTNGTAQISIARISTIENPTNIVNTGDALANVVREQGVATVNGINAAASAAGTIMAATVKTAAK